MAISTYTELQTAVGNWLARSDLTSRIPEFITLAEAKMNRDLSVRQMEQRSTVSVNTSSTDPEFVTLPTDFRSMRWLRLSTVTGKPHLDYLAPVSLSEYRYGRGNATGQPVFFTILDTEIELAPTPDANYTLEMVYRKNIPALASNSTNWLLTLAPDAYLYGALAESAAFIVNDDRIGVWAQGYSNAINALNKLHLNAAFNSGPLTIRATGSTP